MIIDSNNLFLNVFLNLCFFFIKILVVRSIWLLNFCEFIGVFGILFYEV